MNDVMVVTPHSSFRDNLIYDGIAPTAHGNISLSDAANVYCMKLTQPVINISYSRI
ncbi:UNVERIFIED_ORG: hypothetical protein EC838_1221 [Providencia alcalifaciens]